MLELTLPHIELDELEEILEQRREERVMQRLACAQFLYQVESARVEREQRRNRAA